MYNFRVWGLDEDFLAFYCSRGVSSLRSVWWTVVYIFCRNFGGRVVGRYRVSF